MSKAEERRLCVGVDLHKTQFTVSALTEEGEFVLQETYRSSPIGVNNMKTFYCKVLICLVLAASMMLVGCQSAKPEEQGIVYQSPNVKVSLTKETGFHFVDAELMPLTEERVFDRHTVILKGVVSNVKQVDVEYEFMEQHVVDPVTLFDLEVSNVLSCRSDRYPGTKKVSVGIPFYMRYFWAGAPIVKEGASYLLFCLVASDMEDDLLELSEYVDLWCMDPSRLLIEEMDGYYLLTSDFPAKTQEFYSLKQMTDEYPVLEHDLSQLSVDRFDPMKSAARSRLEELFTIYSVSNAQVGQDTLISALLLLRSRTDSEYQIRCMLDSSYLARSDAFEEYVRAVIDSRCSQSNS